MMRLKVISLLLAAAAALTASPGPATETPKQSYFRPKAAQSPRQAAGDIATVNAASFLPGVSPGGLATVFGTNLTDVTGTVVADSNPFPTTLANVSVMVNGIPAPIFTVAYANGQDQISFQVPWQTGTGPSAAYIEVYDYGHVVGSQRVDSFTEDPGIFAYQKYSNSYAVAVHGSDNTLVTPDYPARPGEIVVLYTTGLGPVDLSLPDGLGAPANPLAHTLEPFRVVLSGEDVRLYFSGLAPGFVGLYQLNIRLPDDAPVGDLPLQIVSDYANSQTVRLPVE